MIGTEGFLTDGQRSLVERLGIRIATLVAVQRRKIVQRLSQHRDDRDRGISHRWPAIACRAARRPHTDLGCLYSTARLFSDSRNIGMIGTEGFLTDGQRSLVERLGIRIATLVTVQRRKIVQRCRNIGMIGTEGFLTDGQRSLVERLGIRIATLVAGTASQDCSATSQHRDDRDRGISH